MRVSREPGDGIATAAAQKCVHRTCGLDHLQVSISARMIVGKADRAGISIIDAMARQVRFSVYAVEEMGMTDFAELEQTRAEVMMIASEQQSPAARGEAANPIRIGSGQARADVDREQPQFIEMRIRQVDQVRVITVGVGRPVASCNGEGLVAPVVPQRFQLLRQQREAADMPVIFGPGNRSFEKYSLHLTRPLVHSNRYPRARAEDWLIDAGSALL